jgi:hypothetical protein
MDLEGAEMQTLKSRFLGYFKSHEGDWRSHVDHWLSRARQSVHMLRAASGRESGAVNTKILRQIYGSKVLAQPWYGLEQYGGDPTLCKVDQFIYTTLRRLFAQAVDTPTRAIFAEMGIAPTSIEYEYRKGRLGAREGRSGILWRIKGTERREER